MKTITQVQTELRRPYKRQCYYLCELFTEHGSVGFVDIYLSNPLLAQHQLRLDLPDAHQAVFEAVRTHAGLTTRYTFPAGTWHSGQKHRVWWHKPWKL